MIIESVLIFRKAISKIVMSGQYHPWTGRFHMGSEGSVRLVRCRMMGNHYCDKVMLSKSLIFTREVKSSRQSTTHT